MNQQSVVNEQINEIVREQEIKLAELRAVMESEKNAKGSCACRGKSSAG